MEALCLRPLIIEQIMLSFTPLSFSRLLLFAVAHYVLWTDVCFSHFSRLIRLGNRSAEMNGINFFKGSVQPDLNGLKKCYFLKSPLLASINRCGLYVLICSISFSSGASKVHGITIMGIGLWK
jgi:hypothetical protein